MIFKSLVSQLFYSLAVALGFSPFAYTVDPPGDDSEESLSYNCGRNIASILDHKSQLGPSIMVGDFLLTSTIASDQTPLLIINSKRGLFVSSVDEFAVNRLQFQMRDQVGNTSRYFLSYSHAGDGRPRLHQYSKDTPPAGHENEYFKKIILRRAPDLAGHSNFSTYRTVENIVKAVAAGTIKKSQLHRQDFSDCDRLKLKSPSLGMAMEQLLKQLYEFPSKNDQLRAPASFY